MASHRGETGAVPKGMESSRSKWGAYAAKSCLNLYNFNSFSDLGKILKSLIYYVFLYLFENHSV